MIYLLLAVLIAFFFHRSLQCGYNVDDLGMKSSFDGHKANKYKGWNILTYIKYGSYGAGLCQNAMQEHAVQLIIHYINCCLVYSITHNIIATSLYMINPVNNQTVIWMNGRRYALCLTATLLAWKFKILFIPMYALATYIHVSALAMPLLFLTVKGYAIYVPIGVLLVWLIGRKEIKAKIKARVSQFKSTSELQKIKPQKLVLAVKTIGFYFFHSLFPMKPRMYHEFMYYFSRSEEQNKYWYSLNLDFFKGALALSFIIYEIAIGNFWAVWWLVFMLQSTNIYTVTQNVADRYTVVANVGLMMILAKYLQMLPDIYCLIAFTVIFMFYWLKYQPLFRCYLNVENFHDYHIWIDPTGVEGRMHQAIRYLKMQDPWTAFALIKGGLRHRPKDFKLLFMMSQIMYTMERPGKALEILEKAREFIPLGEEKDYEEQLEVLKTDPRLKKMNILNRQQRRAKKG